MKIILRILLNICAIISCGLVVYYYYLGIMLVQFGKLVQFGGRIVREGK